MPRQAAKSPRKRTYKPQARTQETRSRILDAAQTVFAEQGFEKTQLEQVAARAGYSRGAIYAHYSSKQDVFMALMEQRVYSKFGAFLELMERELDFRRRRGMFKRWVLDQISDPSLGTLNLEFKLYAMRNPRSREKVKRFYELLVKSSGRRIVDLLFGKGLDTVKRAAVERRVAILGAVLSAVTLESHFRPELLSGTQVQAVTEDLFNALINA
ncbi:MAG TPA: helix-turn-helix domain-containing protein [Candidatus Acidoferrum sp.]|nr:helix-turn-helix domain-containing protein [Candidatus Acidoferrum sp.]